MLRPTVEKARKTVSELLGRDSVFSLVQRSLASSLEARKIFDRNWARVLASMNVPTQLDLERVMNKLRDLESDLIAIEKRIRKIKASAEKNSRRAKSD